MTPDDRRKPEPEPVGLCADHERTTTAPHHHLVEPEACEACLDEQPAEEYENVF